MAKSCRATAWLGIQLLFSMSNVRSLGHQATNLQHLLGPEMLL